MKEELNLMIEMLSDTIGTRAVDALGFLLAFAWVSYYYPIMSVASP